MAFWDKLKDKRSNQTKAAEQVKEGEGQKEKVIEQVKEGEGPKEKETENLLGFALLNDVTFSMADFFAGMKEDWGIEVQHQFKGGVLTFELMGFPFILAHIPTSLPEEETAAACSFSFEKDMKETVSLHQSYVMVTLFGFPTAENVNARIAFTKVGMSLMGLNNAGAMFMGANNLVLSASEYRRQKPIMNAAESHNDSYLPVNLWIRIGFTQGEKGIVGYTHGFSDLAKKELEINNADMDLPALHDLLYNLSFNIIVNNANLQNGLIDLKGDEECITVITKIWKSHLSDNEVVHLII